MNYTQIVGHNQLRDDDCIYARKYRGEDHSNLNDIWYLDCRRAFIIDENNEIKPWE
jgi:hypothetical protein